MTINKIFDEDIESLKVASLPSRPTAPAAFGGAGFTARDMKSAFDRLPLYIISRLNELVEQISDSDGIISAIPSGISENHTLKDLTRDITSGAFATYLSVLGEPLADKILAINESISRIDLILSNIDDNSSDSNTALSELSSRIADLEGSLTRLDATISSLTENINESHAEILAAALESTASANEDLNESLLVSLNEVKEELSTDIKEYTDNLTDQIDLIYVKLAGHNEFEIDCGGPGDL